MNREEAIDRAAQNAARFVLGLRPYELMNGSFKHHWTVHPGSFPTRAVEAFMREETTA